MLRLLPVAITTRAPRYLVAQTPRVRRMAADSQLDPLSQYPALVCLPPAVATTPRGPIRIGGRNHGFIESRGLGCLF
ncbi:hypothetical protein B0T19DRAFT_433190 [Cercophora scortea]|uniref:Uncharacterized protein n=1 Tax=Cercophora scortea TaxID=314031 RepID=A0AAE0I8W1_9PEZI|nr:hypothetical protein B0T19DRAFT_433190 [Cercophora scortea]